jgi:hypothetical protein
VAKQLWGEVRVTIEHPDGALWLVPVSPPGRFAMPFFRKAGASDRSRVARSGPPSRSGCPTGRVITMTDLGDRDTDPGDHDGLIRVITMGRNPYPLAQVLRRAPPIPNGESSRSGLREADPHEEQGADPGLPRTRLPEDSPPWVPTPPNRGHGTLPLTRVVLVYYCSHTV